MFNVKVFVTPAQLHLRKDKDAEDNLWPLLMFGSFMFYPPIFCKKKSVTFVAIIIGNIFVHAALFACLWIYCKNYLKIDDTGHFIFFVVVALFNASALFNRWVMFFLGRLLGRYLKKLWRISKENRRNDFPLSRRFVMKTLFLFSLHFIFDFGRKVVADIVFGVSDWKVFTLSIIFQILCILSPAYVTVLWMVGVHAMTQMMCGIAQHLEIVKNVEELRKLRRYHLALCGLCENLDKIFSILITPIIIQSGFTVISFTYFIISRYSTVSVMRLVHFVQAIFFNSFTLITIYIKAEELEKKARSCLQPLHRFDPSHSAEMNQEVEKFKTQVISSPVSMTIWGAVSINKASFIGMIGIMLTYVIVLLQTRGSKMKNIQDDMKFLKLWMNMTMQNKLQK